MKMVEKRGYETRRDEIETRFIRTLDQHHMGARLMCETHLDE